MKAENSISEILKLNTPQISNVNNGRSDKEAGILIFETAILSIINYFGVEWTEMQQRECAQLAFEEYFWFQVAELKHFSVKMKMGHYSEIYGYSKLNPEKMMVCLEEYAGETLRIRGQQKWDKGIASPEEKEMTEDEKQRQQKYFETLKSFRLEFTEQIKKEKESEEEEEERKLNEKKKKVIEMYAAQNYIEFEEAKEILTKKE